MSEIKRIEIVVTYENNLQNNYTFNIFNKLIVNIDQFNEFKKLIMKSLKAKVKGK